MVDAIISSAIKWISSQLVEEAKFLYGVEDQMLKLQNDLECMQRYLQDAEELQLDEKENSQVTIFTETIREIAFRAEDVIDTYILKVSSDSKFIRFAYFRPITYETHVIGKQMEKIQNDIKNAAERINIFKNLGEPSSSHDQLRPQRRVLESYAHIEEDYVVGLDDNIKNLVQRITSGMEEKAEWVVSIVGQVAPSTSENSRRVIIDRHKYHEGVNPTGGNVQTPRKSNGIAPNLSAATEIVKNDEETSSPPWMAFISQLPNWSMLHAAITMIFLAAQKQRMMFNRMPKGHGVLIDPLGLGRSVQDSLVFRQKFSINSYEMGPPGTIFIETMINHSQEAGLNQFNSIELLDDGFYSTPEMSKRNLI
ncbi:hypothetical protein Nepgr_015983 [Nepenthes gracilis]|uniref:Rx N-terminal domain-containing protein n=1 Tax=Nepenthes gracilis TaxID=150966 RepID=A0AAD3XQV9_NEPGR|nr:hypothetical protein Nepgr_015983 [Nepenthes gracilis]